MRAIKMGLILLISAGLFGVLLPNADAIILTFGDSSYGFGTPLDDDGNQTVCADGFELIAVSTPNDNGDEPIGIGLPTGFDDGDITQSPTVGVYSASIVDNYPNRELDLTSLTTPEGFDIVDADGNLAAPRFGQTIVDIVMSETYFELPESDPPVTKPAAGIGSTMFVPDSPLPVGEDVVIITSGFVFYGSNRRVTVVDCEPEPTDVQVEIKNSVVKPDRGFRKLRVHVINDGTFDITAVADLELDGGAPFKGILRYFDVDDDGDLDLTFQVRTRDTTVECGATEMTVTGTVDGEPFANVIPINSRCDLAV